MTIRLTKAKLAEVLSAKTNGAKGEIQFSGVEFDSRAVKPGNLFLALKGSANHGHQFLDQAFANGAALALVEDPNLLKGNGHSDKLLVVDDTLIAFWNLARYWRKEISVPVLAVTGSVGKTTVKELTASVLSEFAPGIYSLKSYNNHVGVPYTLCRIGNEHKWAVVEMGMNHAGEIQRLTEIALPDLALITKVAPAHIENFSSLEEIAQAKLEILSGLTAGGQVILNGDDQTLLNVFNNLKEKQKFKAAYFGTGKNCQARLLEATSQGLNGIAVKFSLFGKELSATLTFPGKHNGLNVCAAALAAKLLCPAITEEQIIRGLSKFNAPAMRLNVRRLASGAQVIDDSYNASPASMASALELLKEMKLAGNKVACILGDMLELGSFAPKYHEQLAELACSFDPEFVVVVGQFAEDFVRAGERTGVEVLVAKTPEEAAELAAAKPFDILLVKASRGVGLDRAAKILL